jgi:uncharacterized protein YgbK (DUF1537 family)
MTMPPILGCIADDLTGATDLALTLTNNGLGTVLLLDVPGGSTDIDAEAVVVALKSRTNPAQQAVADSLASLHWLQRSGARQYFFKYCSTFDSTPRGNIGPVAEALARALSCRFTIFCPALPATGRTVYQGHLFVNGRLLSESSLAQHPLTPMTDPDLVRVLQAQCAEKRVGLLPVEVIEAGVEAIRNEIDSLFTQGIEFAVADCLADRHLEPIAQACSDFPLLTGGSAITAGLARHHKRAGTAPGQADFATLRSLPGPVALFSGSCSAATREQVEQARNEIPLISVIPNRLFDRPDELERLKEQVSEAARRGSFLVSSTADPEAVRAVQAREGREATGARVESTMAELARHAVGLGIRKVVTAGGETSGAVARALGVNRLRVGPQIAPCVPWMVSLTDPPLLLAFKSGNFGEADFFQRAVEMVT